MATKNDVVNRVVAGLVVALMVVIAGYSRSGSTAVAKALNDHEKSVTPHAGIAVNTARFEMIENQLTEITKLLRESP